MDCGGDAECEATCVDALCLRDACAADVTVEVPRIAPIVEDAGSGAVLATSTAAFISAATDPWIDACEWRRAVMRVDLSGDTRVTLRIGPTIDPADTSRVVSAVLAAPQLELVPPELAHMTSVAPLTYFPTDDDRWRAVALAEDTDGSEFRSETYWRRGCEFICPDGVGDSCVAGETPPDRSLLRCYWETQFTLMLDDIERGELIPTGGFAVGNFNYRFFDFAVNLVGVGVRDCSTAELPSACYASGYIPFSLRHDRPYVIRNHLGREYEAPLFVGNVEHGKALTAERYLTNPLSSADRALLADYMRGEFEGRPITGNYTLRVYDAPGLNWERLEDVQLVLNYKYWTRFE